MILQEIFSWDHGSLDKILHWQKEYHGNILTKSFQYLSKMSLEGQPGHTVF